MDHGPEHDGGPAWSVAEAGEIRPIQGFVYCLAEWRKSPPPQIANS